MPLREGKKKHQASKTSLYLQHPFAQIAWKKKTKNTAWPVTLISLDIKYIYVSILQQSLVDEVLWLWLICLLHVTFYHMQQGDKEQKFSHFVYALYSLSLTCQNILRLTAHFVSKAVQLKLYLFQLHRDLLQEKINKFYSSVAGIHCTTVLTTIPR